MYSVANVEKFLDDIGLQGEQREAIMNRCYKVSHCNLISVGEVVQQIFDDVILSIEFEIAVFESDEHEKIRKEAIKAMQERIE